MPSYDPSPPTVGKLCTSHASPLKVLHPWVADDYICIVLIVQHFTPKSDKLRRWSEF